jgi:hypothetical protein
MHSSANIGIGCLSGRTGFETHAALPQQVWTHALWLLV